MFHKRLKELRIYNNYNQEALGKIIGFSPQAISKWEKGITEPNNATIILLSTLFNVSVDYLLGKSDIKNHNDNYYTKIITDENGYSIEIKTEIPFDKLPKEKQKDVIDIAMEKLIEVKKQLRQSNDESK